MRGGKKIVVPVRANNGQVHLNFYSTSRNSVTPIKLGIKEIEGRGIQVLKQFILLGIQEGWWTNKKLEDKITNVNSLIDFIEFGINNEWWDTKIANQIIKKGHEKKLWKDFDTLSFNLGV